MASIEDFAKLDIRIGEIIKAQPSLKAKKPAYQLWIDFGEELGIRKSSAQITDYYHAEDLVGTQILAVVNFPPRQIADFLSEVLVLGACADQGVVLVHPGMPVQNGTEVH